MAKSGPKPQYGEPTEKRSIRIPVSTVQKLEAEASRLGLTFSQLVVRLLKPRS